MILKSSVLLLLASPEVLSFAPRAPLKRTLATGPNGFVVDDELVGVSEQAAIHPFGNGKGTRGDDLQGLLGGKGANLAEMAALGLPVPPGFTMTTDVCSRYHEQGGALPDGVWDAALKDGLAHVEEAMGARLGDVESPLLLSVRSGAAVSMPGMMDTVLNLGLNDEVVEGLAAKTGNPRFAYDSYRRFLDMFGDVVLGIPHHDFEAKLAALKEERGAAGDLDLSAEDLRRLCRDYQDVYAAHGKPFPSAPLEQLRLAIGAVFDSWTSDRAVKYMDINGIRGLRGTAVNVQAMVFGNSGEQSGTGVCFTRNPNDGERGIYGEYLINAQGEDVVAGIRTPQPIAELQAAMPEVYGQLVDTCEALERRFGDMQDIEFTVQDRKLYMLQTRSGKRTGPAAVRIAVDLVSEGLATPEEALHKVTPDHLNQMLHPQFEDAASAAYAAAVIGSGLPASPGAAVGRAAFSAEAAEAMAADGVDCILVRDETSPEDVGGMHAACGMLTARGGMTSHAAVVARGWGRPCVVGAAGLAFTGPASAELDGHAFSEGDLISINGGTGEVLRGAASLKPAEAGPALGTLMAWADGERRLRVLANADTPEDAALARRNGAEGIGLVRTEHMFFEEARLAAMRRMILAGTGAARRAAIEELLPAQRSDFEGIFEAMDGLPVTVRLLDPPLHEFLPCREECDAGLADSLGLAPEELEDAIERCKEHNPMLGLRGCRLGITTPEVVEMQARAVFEAAVNNKRRGLDPRPEVMVPLVGDVAEFRHQAKVVRDTAAAVFAENGGVEVPVVVGTMIETPRAALTAAAIAGEAEFFSFGSNDLTQTTLAISRDDAGTFIPKYMAEGIFAHDPFEVMDVPGVGQLVRMAVEGGKAARPGMHIGVCGEHGGDPESIAFLNTVEGLDYVSCSAFRVPIARLAAAQAAAGEN